MGTPTIVTAGSFDFRTVLVVGDRVTFDSPTETRTVVAIASNGASFTIDSAATPHPSGTTGTILKALTTWRSSDETNADQKVKMVISDQGNVGIGSVAPDSLLHVAGTAQVGTASGRPTPTTGQLKFYNSASTFATAFQAGRLLRTAYDLRAFDPETRIGNIMDFYRQLTTAQAVPQSGAWVPATTAL